MPRKPNVRYFPSRGAYYCNVDGKRHKLAEGPDDAPSGPTFTAARAKFRDILALRNAPSAGDGNTVRVVCEAYLRSLAAAEGAEETYRMRRTHLAAFCNAGFGELAVRDLRPDHWHQYVEGKRRPGRGSTVECRKGWGSGMLRIAFQSIQAALNAGVKGRLIHANPLSGLTPPRARSRGRECVLSPGQVGAALVVARPALRELLVALHNTGARPMEVAGASAADWNEDIGAFVYHKEESRAAGEGKHKGRMRGKDRVIFLTGDALEMARSLVRDRPTGPLFLTARGQPWTPKRIASAFARLARRLKIPGLTAYSFRHTFATNWLLSDPSIDVLAELLGNSASVIRRHYSHLLASPAALRERLERFNNGGGGQIPRQQESADGV